MIEDEATLRSILEETRTVAVVGIKNGETDDAYRVPHYMQENGYRILPVNPRLDQVLNLPCHSSLSDLQEPADLVNLFRASAHIPGLADEILALPKRPRTVWMQLGIHHAEAARRLHDAGIAVVQDRCIMVDHRRWIAPVSPTKR